jgi:transketolase
LEPSTFLQNSIDPANIDPSLDLEDEVAAYIPPQLEEPQQLVQVQTQQSFQSFYQPLNLIEQPVEQPDQQQIVQQRVQNFYQYRTQPQAPQVQYRSQAYSYRQRFDTAYQQLYRYQTLYQSQQQELQQSTNDWTDGSNGINIERGVGNGLIEDVYAMPASASTRTHSRQQAQVNGPHHLANARYHPDVSDRRSTNTTVPFSNHY